RRRHTRFSRDWSSDVCSSDLTPNACGRRLEAAGTRRIEQALEELQGFGVHDQMFGCGPTGKTTQNTQQRQQWPERPAPGKRSGRSEERRVGKECGGKRWTQE